MTTRPWRVYVTNCGVGHRWGDYETLKDAEATAKWLRERGEQTSIRAWRRHRKRPTSQVGEGRND